MNNRRRDDDRPHDDRYKLWAPQDKQPDRYDQRRHRSATIPLHDSNSHPPDTRTSSRPHRQESHNTTAAPPSASLPGPSSSKAQNLTRSSAQNPSAAYHVPTPYSTTTQPPQVPHPSKGYPTQSSRRDNSDPRSYSNRRPQTNPTPRPSYERAPSSEDVTRTSRQPYSSRPVQPTQTTANPTTPSVTWPSSTQDTHVKRSKDRDKERDRYREDRDRDRNVTELGRDRQRERYRSETHRDKDKAVEGERHREQGRFRNEKRMESDSESIMLPDNASKASLSGREGYQPSVRESISGHRRYRTEDPLLSSTARRPQHTEPSHNPTPAVYMQSTGSQAAVVTGSNMPGVGSNPPPAPRVMPVYLPQKPQKSHHERYPSSAVHGGQSGSDADRASVKHRMERNHSGAAVQRGDAYASSVVRERQGQDGPAGPREDTRSKSEAKYSTQGAYHNSRQPLQPTSVNTVDIPLVTPGFNSSPLPHESRGHVGTIPVLVAGEGPADHQTHDALSKLPTSLRRDELQDAKYRHASHAPVMKPSLGRSQSSEVPHSRPEVLPLNRSRTDPAAVDFPYDRNRPTDLVPSQDVSKYPQLTKAGLENQSFQPRSAHKTSFSNPPGGPRPQPSSYAGHQNELSRPVTAAMPVPGPIARVPSNQPSTGHQNELSRPVTAATPAPGPIARVPSNQPSTLPLPAQTTDSSPAKIGSAYGSLPSAHPTTGTSQPQLPGAHGNSAISIKRSPSTPPAHLTPMNSSQAVMNASQSSARYIPHSSESPSRPPVDRLEPHVVAPRIKTAQISNSSTVKSSWVVQTAQTDIPLKNGYPTREEKYSPRNGSRQPVDSPGVAHPQLREVLSQDNHHSSQVAPTIKSRAPSTQGSPKRSPDRGAPKDIYARPRRTPDSSPQISKVKEAPTPEQSQVPLLSLSVPVPPRISVIGATPSSVNHELPHRPQYNASLLVPSYRAPSQMSRTASGSSEYQTRPQMVRTHSATSTASYQQTPALRPQPVAPQPPQPQPSSYASNANGQYSPPPLPIPPPRMLGVDIAEDIFPLKLSSTNPTGVYPPPPSPIVSLQPTQTLIPVTPASTPFMQSSVPYGSMDLNSNKPWPSEETGAAPTPVPAITHPAAIAPPVEARTPVPSPLGTTGSPNGVNQGIAESQHPPSSQGAPEGSHPASHPAPQLKRPKVTIEEVPESPMFTNKWPTSPSDMYPQTPAPKQSYEAPVHSLSVPAAKVQPPETSTPKSTPPSKPKDVPVRPSPTPITPTQSYTAPAPSTQHQAYTLASSRPLYSAPPMQTSFSSSYADTFHQSTQPRGYQRPIDAQPSARILPMSTGASATAAQPARSASQPLNVPQSALLDAVSRDTHMNSQRPIDAQLSAKIMPTSTDASATAAQPARSAFQPLNVPQGAPLDAVSRDTHANSQSTRPLVSASAAAAQGTRPAAYPPNDQVPPLDATPRGRQYGATPTATATIPQPQGLPVVETQTNSQSSRPIASTSVTAAQIPDPLPPNATHDAPLDSVYKGRQPTATTTMTTGTSHPQSVPNVETPMKPPFSRPIVPPMTIPHGPSARAVAGTPATKNQVQDTPIPNDSARRGLLSSASRYALYPAIHRHPPPATSNQQSKPSHPAYSNSHHRTVSLPQPTSSLNAYPRPPSPRKVSQPLVNSSATSTQPFPDISSQVNAPSRSAKAAEPSWSSRVAVSGHPSTPAPSKAHLPPAVNRTFSQESEVLLTPSSIAPSMPKTPQMSFNSVPQATAPAMRQRQASTESRESKKKSGGFLGGLFRTMSGSSRPLDSPSAPSPVKTFIGVQKSPKVAAPPIQQSKSSSSAKELKDRTAAPGTAAKAQTHIHPNPLTSTSAQPHAAKAKIKVKIPDPVSFPPLHPPREHKQPPSSNVFSQFIFLTSKRKRTVSGASVDVCDGSNTANTVIGSPNVSQTQPLPPMPPMPPVRDPMLATSEWRDKAEADQQKRKKNRFRPGVTFDVEEEAPDPGRQKGSRLVRRKSGRSAATPGPR